MPPATASAGSAAASSATKQPQPPSHPGGAVKKAQHHPAVLSPFPAGSAMMPTSTVAKRASPSPLPPPAQTVQLDDSIIDEVDEADEYSEDDTHEDTRAAKARPPPVAAKLPLGAVAAANPPGNADSDDEVAEESATARVRLSAAYVSSPPPPSLPAAFAAVASVSSGGGGGSSALDSLLGRRRHVNVRTWESLLKLVKEDKLSAIKQVWAEIKKEDDGPMEVDYVNRQDATGSTLLFYCESAAMASLLCFPGVNFQLTNQTGSSALYTHLLLVHDKKRGKSRQAIAKVLVDHGADLWGRNVSQNRSCIQLLEPSAPGEPDPDAPLRNALRISANSFANAVADPQLVGVPREYYLSIFQSLDTDRDGLVSSDDIVRFLRPQQQHTDEIPTPLSPLPPKSKAAAKKDKASPPKAAANSAANKSADDAPAPPAATGLSMQERHLHWFVEQWDMDGDGFMSFVDFVRVILEFERSTTPERTFHQHMLKSPRFDLDDSLDHHHQPQSQSQSQLQSPAAPALTPFGLARQEAMRKMAEVDMFAMPGPPAATAAVTAAPAAAPAASNTSPSLSSSSPLSSAASSASASLNHRPTRLDPDYHDDDTTNSTEVSSNGKLSSNNKSPSSKSSSSKSSKDPLLARTKLSADLVVVRGHSRSSGGVGGGGRRSRSSGNQHSDSDEDEDEIIAATTAAAAAAGNRSATPVRPCTRERMTPSPAASSFLPPPAAASRPLGLSPKPSSNPNRSTAASVFSTAGSSSPVASSSSSSPSSAKRLASSKSLPALGLGTPPRSSAATPLHPSAGREPAALQLATSFPSLAPARDRSSTPINQLTRNDSPSRHTQSPLTLPKGPKR